MSWFEIISLSVAGLFVGFFNTLAGGATVISISLLMMLGLPAGMANGTHRIAAVFQTLTSTLVYRRRKLIDFPSGLKWSLPMTAGSMAGAWTAVRINDEAFGKIVAIVMVLVTLVLLFRPKLWKGGGLPAVVKGTPVARFFIFLGLGFYGGFIYIGIGYFLIITLLFLTGNDLLRANAMKVFLVLVYVTVSLSIYLANGLVHLQYGLVLSAGQVAGAWLGARYSVRHGPALIMMVMILFVVLTFLQAFGLADIGRWIISLSGNSRI
ncbi:MAG: sulfite exporter TauE/SafE family protein [Bacteroidales bacterium]|nr:sulfite exporter TauE/SafE family protein [Bacteroidales bacterium]